MFEHFLVVESYFIFVILAVVDCRPDHRVRDHTWWALSQILSALIPYLWPYPVWFLFYQAGHVAPYQAAGGGYSP